MISHTFSPAVETAHEVEKTIPNTQLEEMFYKSVTDMDDVQTFRKLKAEGNMASATALASRKVRDRLYELLDREHEMHATVEKYEGPSIYDHPEMLN